MVPGWYPSLGDEDPKIKVYLGKSHWVVRVLFQNRVGAKDEDLAARYSQYKFLMKHQLYYVIKLRISACP